jgi:hypothetical protein
MPEALDPESKLWERVHAHLDARRDPLEDVELARALRARPALERRVAALTRGLRALEPRRRGRARPLWIAAAAALALAAVFWSRRADPVVEPAAPASLALRIERGAAEAPRGARRRLEPQVVLHWIPQGERP